VHVSHTHNLVVAASGNHHLESLKSWRKMVQVVRGFNEDKALIHVALSVYKALVLCSSSAKRKVDSEELYDLQVQSLVSVKPALILLLQCRDANKYKRTEYCTSLTNWYNNSHHVIIKVYNYFVTQSSPAILIL
ncbi:MAG: ribosome-binding ATPase YchF (GTP1/OBG family), partial [Bacillariaceae sp.]|jgi:ribosome-binding ATPase YchF (GTP1/OBG family)